MKLKNLSNKILRSIKSGGFKNIELDSVIETKYILRRSGENFRKFLFSFQDLKGNELCLRPDLTIASCLRYLENDLSKILIAFLGVLLEKETRSFALKFLRDLITFILKSK